MDTKRFPSLAAAAALVSAFAALAPAALAQDFEARPYGPDGDSLRLALTHDVPGQVLEVFGGRPGDPAGIVLGDAPGERPLPGDQRLLVAGAVRGVFGRFDGAGRFVLPLTEVPEAAFGAVFYAQGLGVSVQHGSGFAFTRGVALEVRPEEAVEPPVPPALPEPPLGAILVEEIAALFDARQAEEAVALALNSDGDKLALDVAGELQIPVPNPFVPTLAVGGKAGFKAKVERGTDSTGAAVYVLAIGADVAATAGVSAGVAGAGAAGGQGGEVLWRFTSPEEVVRAIRSMAILQATGQSLERACQLLDGHLGIARETLEAKRAAEDTVRTEIRRRVPLRRLRVVQKLRAFADERREERHERVDAGLELVEELVHLVADARSFLDEHVHGFELRKASAVSGKVGVGDIGDADKGGSVEFANIGANLGGSVERQLVLRTELVPETGGLRVEAKLVLTKKIAAGAGFGVGVEGEVQRVLEACHREQFDADGYAFEAGGTIVKLSLDGKLAASLGVIATGKAAVGGQVQAVMNLRDLLAYGADGVAILLGDDTDRAARLLRSIPITLSARAGYEAGFGLGLGVNLGKEYFKAGVSAAATYSDQFAPVEYQGERDGSALEWMLGNGPLDAGAAVVGQLDQVRAEVTRVMAR